MAISQDDFPSMRGDYTSSPAAARHAGEKQEALELFAVSRPVRFRRAKGAKRLKVWSRHPDWATASSAPVQPAANPLPTHSPRIPRLLQQTRSRQSHQLHPIHSPPLNLNPIHQLPMPTVYHRHSPRKPQSPAHYLKNPNENPGLQTYQIHTPPTTSTQTTNPFPQPKSPPPPPPPPPTTA